MGNLHPQACMNQGIAMKEAPVLLEINLELLFRQVQEGIQVDSEVRNFPAATRDISF